jgi:hypothetical protein|tara:strand:+ start:25 stop:279 length:255 start_codon:yes stop_codon:yes gene_type:complete
MAQGQPIGERPKGLNINIGPGDMKDICCAQCGSKYFRQVQAFKRLSALISPTGKEQIIPIPVFRCDECGFINEEFRPVDGQEDK